MTYSPVVIEGKNPFYYNIVRKGGNMFTLLSDHKILTGFISFFLLSSVACQMIAGVIYHNMISESDNMSDTQNKLLMECKQKYANYYKLNGKMVNTGVFVDRFLQTMRFAKIRISRFTHISGQFMMLSIFVTGLSICFSLAAGNTLFQIIPYYLVSILGLYLYFSVSGFVDVQEKKKILKTNMTDYLENYYTPRLEMEKENAMEEGIKKREKYAKEFFEMEDKEEKVRMKEENASMMEDSVMGQYQDELENLLEEFFA
ncbi:hypothetical protein D5281_16865 [bacterium 1xD42-62]|uniref:Uncharacterized protein n=2 Tax=Parablautia muri TaxID=2320879 RepID=A0A9X5GTP2_9FIRM|nr:hypothetical protein [Parablautia muri]